MASFVGLLLSIPELLGKLVKIFQGPSLYLKADIGGSEVRNLEQGSKLVELTFTLKMVNEEPPKPLRIEGVKLGIPELSNMLDVPRFEGRLGNKHWEQSWPLHLRNDEANLRIPLNISDVSSIPETLGFKVSVRAPKGIRKVKILKGRLPVPAGAVGPVFRL